MINKPKDLPDGDGHHEMTNYKAARVKDLAREGIEP